MEGTIELNIDYDTKGIRCQSLNIIVTRCSIHHNTTKDRVKEPLLKA